MNKRLLITGANGFVGSHLAEMALEGGFEVYAAVRKTSDLGNLDGLKVTLVYPEYNNVNSLTAMLDQYDITHIAHVAGLTKGRTPEDYMRANATVSTSLAEAALATKHPIQKFVFVSSLAIMGPRNEDVFLTELQEPQPVTLYGKSKWKAEQSLGQFNDLPIITLRPTAVYGPREKDMLIVINMVRKGWELYLGNKAQKLSFIYVKDLCKAILLSLESPLIQKTYLLSDGENYDRYAFASQVKRILHKKTIRMHIPVGIVSGFLGILERLIPSRTSILNQDKLKELTGSWACNIDNAKSELGYIPQYPLNKGIGETIAWNKARNWSS